jgi:hypothetical protein
LQGSGVSRHRRPCPATPGQPNGRDPLKSVVKPSEGGVQAGFPPNREIDTLVDLTPLALYSLGNRKASHHRLVLADLESGSAPHPSASLHSETNRRGTPGTENWLEGERTGSSRSLFLEQWSAASGQEDSVCLLSSLSTHYWPLLRTRATRPDSNEGRASRSCTGYTEVPMPSVPRARGPMWARYHFFLKTR